MIEIPESGYSETFKHHTLISGALIEDRYESLLSNSDLTHIY